MTRPLAIAAILAAIAPAAGAQQASCAKRDQVLALLAERYGEARRAWAMTGDGALLEAFVSPDGSWTILITIPGSPNTCIFAAGRNWTDILEPKGEPT